MPKKKSDPSKSSGDIAHYKHHLLPSALGGGVAYLLSGVVALGLIVFAVVWAGNMLSHKMHKH
jgi:hypothetical protein